MADMLIDYGPLVLIGLAALAGFALAVVSASWTRVGPPEAPKPPALPDPAAVRKAREEARGVAAAEDQVYRG